MQLRCSYCQTMFALSRDEMLAGLQHMSAENLNYYDAHCPKCRRANRVERKRMEMFFPKWKEAIKAMTKEATQAEKETGPAKPAPAEKRPASPKPAAKKPAKKNPASSKKATGGAKKK